MEAAVDTFAGANDCLPTDWRSANGLSRNTWQRRLTFGPQHTAMVAGSVGVSGSGDGSRHVRPMRVCDGL